MDALVALAEEIELAEAIADAPRLPSGVRPFTVHERRSGVDFGLMDLIESNAVEFIGQLVDGLQDAYAAWLATEQPSGRSRDFYARLEAAGPLSIPEVAEAVAPIVGEIWRTLELAAGYGWCSTIPESQGRLPLDDLDQLDNLRLDLLAWRTVAGILSALTTIAANASLAGQSPIVELRRATLGATKATFVLPAVILAHRHARIHALGTILGKPHGGAAHLAEEVSAHNIVASEILDRNTCKTCKAIDGHAYATWEDATLDYPNGIYRYCQAGPRCRGTLLITWDAETGAKAPRPNDEPIDIPGMTVAAVNQRLANISRRLPISTTNTPEGDDSWYPTDPAGWSILRNGHTRVRRLDERTFRAEVLYRDMKGREHWTHALTGIWARIAELPEIDGLLPPGYSWALSEDVSALSFDETEHPRDPGGKDGGRFIPKGTTGVDEGKIPFQDPKISPTDRSNPAGRFRDWVSAMVVQGSDEEKKAANAERIGKRMLAYTGETDKSVEDEMDRALSDQTYRTINALTRLAAAIADYTPPLPEDGPSAAHVNFLDRYLVSMSSGKGGGAYPPLTFDDIRKTLATQTGSEQAAELFNRFTERQWTVAASVFEARGKNGDPEAAFKESLENTWNPPPLIHLMDRKVFADAVNQRSEFLQKLPLSSGKRNPLTLANLQDIVATAKAGGFPETILSPEDQKLLGVLSPEGIEWIRDEAARTAISAWVELGPDAETAPMPQKLGALIEQTDQPPEHQHDENHYRTSDESSTYFQWATDDVVKRVAQRLLDTLPKANGPLTEAEAVDLAAGITHAWAVSSHSQTSVMMMESVAKLFDVPIESVDGYLNVPRAEHVAGVVNSKMGFNRSGVILTRERMDAYVRAVYEETQAKLQSMGVEWVPLMRGMRCDGTVSDIKGSLDGRLTVSISPVSSWTTSKQIADSFRLNSGPRPEGGSMGLILKQKFHRSRIFSIGAWSGPGCSGEQEVTAIAAGREPVRILQGDAYVGPQGRGQERASDNRFARVYYKSDDETGELRVSGTTNGNLNMTKRADIENAIDEMSKPYTPSAEQAAAIARRNGSAKPPMKAVAPKHEAKQKLPVPGNDTFEKDLAKLLADPKVNIPPDLVEALKKNHALQVKGKP